MSSSAPNTILEIAECWPNNEESPGAIRRVGIKRLLVGAAFFAGAIGGFCLAVFLGGAYTKAIIEFASVPMAISGVALIPWEIAEILTGRKWQQINPFVRILFLVIGFPSFIAVCIAVATVIARLANA